MNHPWLFILLSAACGLLLKSWMSAALAVFFLLLFVLFGLSRKKPSRTRFLSQSASAYIFGGLCFGLGLQFLLGFLARDRVVFFILVPASIWFSASLLFAIAKARFSLEKIAGFPVPSRRSTLFPDIRSGTASNLNSAWNGDTEGGSSIPDASGARVLWNFWCTSEIAMGGPTTGDAIFSNSMAFTGVGPSIAISPDGRWAAMTEPSRGRWGLLLVDLSEKKLWRYREESPFWELDSLEGGILCGRDAPLVSNRSSSLSVEALVAHADPVPLVQDDGWWVVPDARLGPLPTWEAVTISHGSHRVTFVPDLKPFREDPFRRYSAPRYTVLVDDQLLEGEARTAEALWLDGKNLPGRFLLMGEELRDFRDPTSGEFSVSAARKLSLWIWTHMSAMCFTGFSADGPGFLLACAEAEPRRVEADAADSASMSVTSPWDEDEALWWSADGKQHTEQRTLVKRKLTWRIDLDRFADCGSWTSSSLFTLENRALPEHTAEFSAASDAFVPDLPWAAYRARLSSGLECGLVTSEAIWSRCGRYLALLRWEAPPAVPSKLLIVDFEQKSLREIPGDYSLSSFIWFDREKLEFSYITGVQESIVYGPGQHEETFIPVSSPEFRGRPCDLLLSGLEARHEAMKVKARNCSRGGNTGDGSARELARHAILFAPAFDQIVPQPPL